MADLFRVLMRDNRDLAPLADEVELCRQYLELEQLRLGDRLQVEWNLKSMPGDALVPPLVLQPLLENAVYHGIEPSSAPGMVSINVFLTRGEVHAILKNPYRADGGRHHSGNKMALANVRERLALHFDAEASLESRITKDALRSAYPHAVPHRGSRCRARPSARGQRAARNHERNGATAAASPCVRSVRAVHVATEVRMSEPALRILLVDDEAPARRRLRDLLDDCATALPLVVVGEAQQGREALDLLQSAPADLVLTDIHMPDMDGIELARHLLKLAHPPVVIFTTAFHEHAVQAFEVNAIDYLMKPIRVQRLLGALQKVPRLKPVSAEKLSLLPASARRFLSVTERSRVVLVPLDDIVYLKAELKYITIRTAQREYLLEESLTKLEGEFGNALRPGAPQLPRRPRLHPRLRAPRQRRRRLALGGAVERGDEIAAGLAPPAIRRARRGPRNRRLVDKSRGREAYGRDPWKDRRRASGVRQAGQRRIAGEARRFAR